VRIEVLRPRGPWRPVGAAKADRRGRFRHTLRPGRRIAIRATTEAGTISNRVTVRVRPVLLAAVGDVNLGNGPGAVMALRGLRYPWTGTAKALRAADLTFGNLECAVSTRGAPVPKEFNFRGRPAALRVMARFAGFDVLNLANNHVGDFGPAAMLDTVRGVERLGMKAVGARLTTISLRQTRWNSQPSRPLPSCGLIEHSVGAQIVLLGALDMCDA
jgi:hypothetical protein